jgi:hypothetical protein
MERSSISSKAHVSIGSTSCLIFLSLYLVPLVLEGQIVLSVAIVSEKRHVVFHLRFEPDFLE